MWLFHASGCSNDGQIPHLFDSDKICSRIGLDRKHIIIVDAVERHCRLCFYRWLPCAPCTDKQVCDAEENGLQRVIDELLVLLEKNESELFGPRAEPAEAEAGAEAGSRSRGPKQGAL